MSQSTMAVANSAGATYRAAVNAALQALASLNSGATTPSETYAYQLWADTTNDLLKIRNAANTAWINVMKLSTAVVEGLVPYNRLASDVTPSLQGIQQFRKLVSYPQSTTTYTVIASDVVTVNPSTGQTRRCGAVNVTSSSLTGAQAGSAANGRDQSATFASGIIFAYVITGQGQTPATLYSLSESAPTLPAGYTEWAIVGPIRWGGTIFDYNYRYSGNKCAIDSGVTVLSNGSATTETAIGLSGLISASVDSFRIRASETSAMTADASANTIAYLVLRNASGLNQASYVTPAKSYSASASGTPTWLGKEVEIVNISGSASLYYMHTISAGSAMLTTLLLTGFTYSNGAD